MVEQVRVQPKVLVVTPDASDKIHNMVLICRTSKFREIVEAIVISHDAVGIRKPFTMLVSLTVDHIRNCLTNWKGSLASINRNPEKFCEVL